ncbi:MAG: pyruvate kinase [Xanthomonadales bacterium]|nr:pyruvate kinase [Gammaproteobacteria bacterium]MBT8054408.1 pyruvate kinase [Gammaproteobacteria bacterium]NND56780.1 pyruvate kinase [Xanthomonadales bacterium]NNK51123.1 pyruvate kinase [Xanthomonadales bacterium]
MTQTRQQPPPAGEYHQLTRELESLRAELELRAKRSSAARLALPTRRQPSAENLHHYLALRSRDLRPLQLQLANLGLSSLGRAEPHVMATLDAVLSQLRGLQPAQTPSAVERNTALEENTDRLLGERPTGRRTRIMVTMPAEAAQDYMLIYRLLESGMNCMRINCSHDDADAWLRMIHHLRDAERATGKSCRILMDLGGPKLRTGPMELLPAVKKIRPVRDDFGRVLRHARIWLTADEASGSEIQAADACLTTDADWLSDCKVGDRVLLRDARDSKRRWRIREVTPFGCWAESRKTTYVTNGTVLRLRGFDRETEISALPQTMSVIKVRTDDVLLIVNSGEPGAQALRDDNGELLSPGRVSLPIPEIYRDARRGDSVCFDDGRIAGIIEKKNPNQLQVRITHTRREVEKLAADKGVNFPDSELSLPALGEKDLENLEFVAQHADLVGLSFTNRPADVRDLRQQMRKLGCEDLGVVLKIETRWGFANLPDILLEAMKLPAFGVMIARGDLAVECGFVRLAEVQEEILWLCEAAHVPAIWATQVLEGLTRRGHASRAEITDAGRSEQAECVMLNKGPHITEAVQTLDDILRRMQGLQDKKSPLLRKLGVAAEFSGGKA